MSKNGSMWKKLIRKTFKKQEEVRSAADEVRVELEKRRKGIIRTIIDDHRDAALYRHALCAIYLKLMGFSSGFTPNYKDETGFVRPIFKEINRLRKRIEELEALINQHHTMVYPHVPNCDHASVNAVVDKNAMCYG